MPSRPLEPRLNRFPHLRYDNGHSDGDTPTDSNSLPPHPADSQTGSADMDVNGPGSVHGTSPIHSIPTAHEVERPADSSQAVPQDEIEISPAGKMLEELSQSPQIQAERLAQLKAAIEAGSYDTPEKLEAALERMIAEIGLEPDRSR